MALVPSTKLDAVNTCLTNIGESPVTSLDGGLLVDAQIASGIVDEICREVQSAGWFFNTETHTLIPDTSGSLNVPASTLSAHASGNNKYWNLALRGTRMYDLDNNTYAFTVANVTLEIIVYLDFTLLPEPARRLIGLRAARLFQERQLGVDSLAAQNTKDEERAWAAMLHEESDTGGYNITNVDSVRNAMDRSF
jgi:hypothetical protein